MKLIKDQFEFWQRGISFFDHDVNKLVKFHTERLWHFLYKSTLFYLLRKLGHDVITEFEITGLGIGDLLDLTTKVQYEIESSTSPKKAQDRANQYKRKGIEIIVINLRKAPRDVKGMIEFLKEHIVPD